MALGFLSLVGIISHYLIPSRAAERDLMSPLCFKPARSYGGVDSLKLISELLPLSRFGQQRVRLMKLLIANAPNPNLFPQAYAQQITLVEPGGIPCYLPVMMSIHSTFSATDCSIKSCGRLIVLLYIDIRKGILGCDYGTKHEFACA